MFAVTLCRRLFVYNLNIIILWHNMTHKYELLSCVYIIHTLDGKCFQHSVFKMQLICPVFYVDQVLKQCR
jgi:hypothetical protein